MTVRDKERRAAYMREYKRKWIAANPDKVAGQRARYRAAHPEKIEAFFAQRWALGEAWRAANPEEAKKRKREQNRAWRAANPDKKRAQNARWRERRRETSICK
jgi:hypothetical protein